MAAQATDQQTNQIMIAATAILFSVSPSHLILFAFEFLCVRPRPTFPRQCARWPILPLVVLRAACLCRAIHAFYAFGSFVINASTLCGSVRFAFAVAAIAAVWFSPSS